LNLNSELIRLMEYEVKQLLELTLPDLSPESNQGLTFLLGKKKEKTRSEKDIEEKCGATLWLLMIMLRKS
ncbi:hypothetical protein STEG23_028326, partial [Scotinomys teguina]